jgi:hypothetical protein
MNEGEKKFMFYQRGIEGSFFTALFDAIMKADQSNLNKLKLAFPEEATVVEKFRNEPGYYQDLERKFNNAM